VLRVVRKGARKAKIPLTPATVAALEAYLADRAAATFRIGLIMERGLMRQRISPGSSYAGLRRWDGR